VIYGLGTIIRYFSTSPKKISKPVICIGNLVAGGAGKTPIAIEIGMMLREMGVNFAYLSYGYGREGSDFVEVSTYEHSALQVGDEPLLLSEIADTFVVGNRISGALKIEEMAEKQMIIMDDGFQNPFLFKDLQILVVDGFYGFGNQMMMPSGPLREPISFGADRANIVVIVGEDKTGVEKYFAGKKIVHAKIKTINHGKFKNQKVVAFCGIGRPKKFFHSLKDAGIEVVKIFYYADHYVYKKSDLDSLVATAREHGAKLVTTKKDWVRIEPDYQSEIDYLDIRIEFDDSSLIKEELNKLL
jgi:tetraacyldisaccharide 4'-kinase